MKSIEIIATGSYLPSDCVESREMEQYFKLEEGYILKRTGIDKRFIAKEETIEELAIKSVENLLETKKIELQEIDMILVGTTSTNQLMPGISFLVQKHFRIQNCICLDVLAGCNSYINCLDIARSYIAIGKIEKALIIGVEMLTKYVDEKDMGTAILFSDGAGATLIGKTKEKKEYASYIRSDGERGDILTCRSDSKIYMNGKEIYKYAVTETITSVQQLLQQAGRELEEITYLVPHQSNQRIMEAIANRIGLPLEKMYSDIKEVGNTFSASIPIALDEMRKKNLLQKGDKIILLGYGGGLNTGSILLEI